MLLPFTLLQLVSIVWAAAETTWRPCPWSESDKLSACFCNNESTVRCDLRSQQQRHFENLVRALAKRDATITELQINCTETARHKNHLSDRLFADLQLEQLRVYGCRIQSVQQEAFHGLRLKHLDLRDNEIEIFPRQVNTLYNLTSVDLSKNKLKSVPDDGFIALRKLSTVKLTDNKQITIADNAFRGLGHSLKILNLKNTGLKLVPKAVKFLKALSFLDLSQNNIAELSGNDGLFEGLDSLMSLNLEQNLIHQIAADSFLNVRNTLSSLSLLNNLLTEFPMDAVSTLEKLKVLDIGFNLISTIPKEAFSTMHSLTLLALDGNPMVTIPSDAILNLNSTLRGLSLGGHYLQCDCKLKWMVDWIKQYNVQITSREKNPKFCATPQHLRDVHFTKLTVEDLCPEVKQASESIDRSSNIHFEQPSTETISTESPPPKTTIITKNALVSSENSFLPELPQPVTLSSTRYVENYGTYKPVTSTILEEPKSRNTFITRNASSMSSTNRQMASTTNKILTTHSRKTTSADDEVVVKQAYRSGDNSVMIQWDSGTDNILGFRVVYRLFGEDGFKQGPPLDSTEREFKIKNVPAQECIVICVVSLEDLNITPDSIPHRQCREIRTISPPANNMDKITIAASAAICCTVIITVMIFATVNRCKTTKLDTISSYDKKTCLPTSAASMACFPNTNMHPHSSMANLSAFTSHKDWDQHSIYSARSLNRARTYHMDHGLTNDF